MGTAEILQEKHLEPRQCLLSSVGMALIYHAGGVHSAFYSSEVFEPLLQARPLSALVLISYLLFWCHLKLLGFRVQFSNLFICVEIWDFFFLGHESFGYFGKSKKMKGRKMPRYYMENFSKLSS